MPSVPRPNLEQNITSSMLFVRPALCIALAACVFTPHIPHGSFLPSQGFKLKKELRDTLCNLQSVTWRDGERGCTRHRCKVYKLADATATRSVRRVMSAAFNSQFAMKMSTASMQLVSGRCYLEIKIPYLTPQAPKSHCQTLTRDSDCALKLLIFNSMNDRSWSVLFFIG
ncbi:hypothetical protein B0J15DRAFT_63451 [Fusarium solani]|uniref:Uncharacterized protein n=1 Tax=Fusarium solani TaxID=169388 RepID=A0A9P9H1F7_FUSSL|nr:uncharacterized protein B0J15DRAFT_63451 [Fusarium solani]KAH7248469.1 hypothetical protein B0J15DRAFT_63451 [Fusarium solani]